MMAWRSWLILRLLVAAVALALFGAVLSAGLAHHSVSAGGDPLLPVTQRSDQPAPGLSGPTLTGTPFDITAFHGHVVLVNVMASWCAACHEELPVLAAAAAQWPGLRVVGLAMRDRPDQAASMLDGTPAAAMTIVPDPDGTRAIDWGVRGVPESFVVDKDGRLRLHAFGPISHDWLRRELPSVLGQ